MRFAIIFVVTGLLFAGCKKDKVNPDTSSATSYYQTDGNFLILVIGDSLESAYEYNLPSIQLSNDSLQLNYQSVPDGTGLYTYQYWKLQPNSDTLFWTYLNGYKFMEEQINSNSLLSLNSPLVFDANQFQTIGSASNMDIEDLWSKVSQLDITKTYKESSPNSKIGISRQVLFIYDEQLGFSIPQIKYLLFMVK